MNERITSIDAVRGTALFGILIVNILAFSSVWYGSGLAGPLPMSGLDEVLTFFVSAVFELKFYLLFSFLFGYSVTLQIQSAANAGQTFLPRILRRQAGLLTIGILHAVVLFHGDILTTYAFLGLALLVLRSKGDKLLLIIAGALIVGTALLWLAIAAEQWIMPAQDDTQVFQNHADAAIAAWGAGPLDIIVQHLRAFEDFAPMLFMLQAPCAFAMFLVGFAAGRRQVFAKSEIYRPKLVGILSLSLLIGLPGAFSYAAATQFAAGSALETAGLAISIVTAPFMTMAILTMLLMIFDNPRVQWIGSLLASTGRMALSNYLLQSLVCALIFHGYGLALIDQLRPSVVLGIAAMIFAVQVAISHLWLKRFRYGPIEWVLRAITICGLPKLTIESRPSAS